MEQVIDGADTIRDKGPGQVSPFAIPALSGSMAAALVSMKYGLTGPVMTQVAACASAVIAFQDALRLIRLGRVRRRARRWLRGADRSPMAFAALGNMTALSKRNDDPRGRRRGRSIAPATGSSSARAPGSSSSNRAEHALSRGATILAEVIGGGADGRRLPHLAPRSRPGAAPAMAMTMAMRHAGVGTERDRLHRRPRHVHAAERRDRDTGDQDGLRRHALRRSRSVVAEVDGRPHLLGAAGRAVGDRGRRRDPRRRASRRRATTTSRTRNATSTTSRT